MHIYDVGKARIATPEMKSFESNTSQTNSLRYFLVVSSWLSNCCRNWRFSASSFSIRL